MKHLISNILLLVSFMALCLNGQNLKADDECYSEEDPECIEIMIAKEAIKQHFSVDVAVSIAKVESGLKMSARGSKGEIGLFQIMPYFKGNLKDIHTNIRLGIYLLKQAQIKCSDMGVTFVICYNQGPTRRPKHPLLHPYYRKVAMVMHGR